MIRSMIKQKQLKKTLKDEILKLKEAWAAFEKERDLPKDNLSYSASPDRVTNLVRLVLKVLDASNGVLDAFVEYTNALEKKLNKKDSKRKKK